MDKWEFYTDSSGEHRWRRTAPNGRIVGASSQGYANRSDCVANAQRNGYTGS
ncbi:YegP family protein [Pseudomonas sp. EA_35y_Pfl2_R111]|uniref:YegP family protein n=1 Tax=Pseudomonas sp. EA_35y_Pfl2_R111 TaxID=3088689 RepID=UPI0030D90518